MNMVDRYNYKKEKHIDMYLFPISNMILFFLDTQRTAPNRDKMKFQKVSLEL